MRINKKKLREALKIIDMTPMNVIRWIKDCKRIELTYLCVNEAYWDKPVNIQFNDQERYSAGDYIFIPRFFFLNKQELNWCKCIESGQVIENGQVAASTFSRVIYENTSIRKELINALTELSNDG